LDAPYGKQIEPGKPGNMCAVIFSWRFADIGTAHKYIEYCLPYDMVQLQESEDEQIGPEQGLFLLRADARDLPFREQQIDYVARDVERDRAL
jgi:hypothetical protein